MKKTLSETIGDVRYTHSSPLWEGPCSDGKNGGITFSLLSRFLSCRARFYVHTIEGIRTQEQFNHRLEYGSLWHTCEEAYAGKRDWELALQLAASVLCQKYPWDQPACEHWYKVCKAQFPVYLAYWEDYAETWESVEQEKVFHIPYTLPSKRTVFLRGKRDGVDSRMEGGEPVGDYLFEIKTKGDIDEELMKRQLTYDLQTGFYLTALTRDEARKHRPLLGLRYNVVRRPLSGGKGTIKQKQNESSEEFYNRLTEYMLEEPERYFMRWVVDVSPLDIQKFQYECLTPLLETLCDWYAAVSTTDKPFETGLHFRHPYGCTNYIDESGWTELDNYLNHRSMNGLRKVKTLFAELEV